MNAYKKNYLKITLTLLIFGITLNAGILIPGDNDSGDISFDEIIESCAFDPFNGNLYVSSSTASSYKIARSNRYLGGSNHKFIGIAPTEISSNTDSVPFLTLSHDKNSDGDIVGSISEKVFIMTNNGKKYTETVALNDTTGTTTGVVTQLASNQGYAVAAIAPSANPIFGQTNSGLALINISRDNGTLNLTVKNAQNGTNGNMATKLDNTSAVFTGITSGTVTIESNAKPSLLYDKPLNRFYIGTNMATGSTMNNLAISVATAAINSSDQALQLESIIDNNSIINMNNNQIITAQNTDNSTPQNLKIIHLGVMHASTGPSYLIIVGGNNTTNTVYALPLVNTPNDQQTNGKIANITSDLTNGKFTEAATTSIQFPTTTTLLARVGVNSLPIENLSTSNTISDLVIQGDTVYVSIKATANQNNEPGVFYSQALFDDQGRIISWTPWTKKVISHDPFEEKTINANAESTSFFNVDAVNGKVWFIHNDTTSTSAFVGSTAWVSPDKQPSNTLASQLNNQFNNQYFTILDLDQATRGFCNQSRARYALFGGYNQVIFARISVATNTSSSPTINAPQTAVTDFSQEENFLVTYLPGAAGACTCLEYSRRLNSDGPQNYFFAGTSEGFYVFADKDTGAGFTIDTNTNSLSSDPFLSSTWHKVESVESLKNSVVSIISSGLALYVLTRTKNNINSVYRIDFQNNLTAMFTESNIHLIAQTGQSPFTKTSNGNEPTENINFFYDIAPINNNLANPSITQEQLVLATSRGLYISNATSGIQNVTNISNAIWQNIPEALQGPFLSIKQIFRNAYIDSNNPTCQSAVASTLWPIGLSDPTRDKLFSNANFAQLVSGPDNGSLSSSIVPSNFISKERSSIFETIPPIYSFTSDGNRRFVISRSLKTGRNQLSLLPLDEQKWNLSQVNQPIVSDIALEDVTNIFEITMIGNTGRIYMATNLGIFTLE